MLTFSVHLKTDRSQLGSNTHQNKNLKRQKLVRASEDDEQKSAGEVVYGGKNLWNRMMKF